MTMHVVLGDGEMTRKELTETLADLWKADEESGATFWFLVQGKKDPSTTDQNLVKWLEANDIYYEVITDDQESMDAVYSQPQEVHIAKRLGQKIVNLLGSKPEKDEEAELLTLFFSDDSNAEEDQWLNRICQDVFDGGYKVRALNDGLLEVDLSAPEEGGGEPEETPDNVTPIKAVAKKAVAKKGGAAPRRDTQVSEEVETATASAASSTYTRDQLEDMELPQLKEIAATMDISFPSRTRMTTYIDAILGEDRPAVEITQPEEAAVGAPSLNGEIDVEALADAILGALITRLEKALA